MQEIKNRQQYLRRELKRWIEILKNKYRPEKIIVFGSFAKGNIRQWSDIDLVIIKNTQRAFLDRTREVLLLLRPKVGVDILVYTPREFEILCQQRRFFKNEINKNGVIIYGE